MIPHSNPHKPSKPPGHKNKRSAPSPLDQSGQKHLRGGSPSQHVTSTTEHGDDFAFSSVASTPDSAGNLVTKKAHAKGYKDVGLNVPRSHTLNQTGIPPRSVASTVYDQPSPLTQYGETVDGASPFYAYRSADMPAAVLAMRRNTPKHERSFDQSDETSSGSSDESESVLSEKSKVYGTPRATPPSTLNPIKETAEALKAAMHSLGTLKFFEHGTHKPLTNKEDVRRATKTLGVYGSTHLDRKLNARPNLVGPSNELPADDPIRVDPPHLLRRYASLEQLHNDSSKLHKDNEWIQYPADAQNFLNANTEFDQLFKEKHITAENLPNHE